MISIPPPKNKRRFWKFKAKLVKEASAFTIGHCYCETLAEAFRLHRMTWGGKWILIPNGKSL